MRAISATPLAFASPKSSTFTTPSGVIMTLVGFRSRWMMPFSWAASSASTIWRAMARASCASRPDPRAFRRASRASSVSPSTSSMTRALTSPLSSSPWIGRDVGVIQRCEHASLALEAGEPFGIDGEDGWQHLNRHVASEPCVVRAVDVAHPARSDGRHDCRSPAAVRSTRSAPWSSWRVSPQARVEVGRSPCEEECASRDSTSAVSSPSPAHASARKAARVSGGSTCAA